MPLEIQGNDPIEAKTILSTAFTRRRFGAAILTWLILRNVGKDKAEKMADSIGWLGAKRDAKLAVADPVGEGGGGALGAIASPFQILSRIFFFSFNAFTLVNFA